jgi:protein-(glutamine-N5) methyltransferase, release factor-specific
MKLKEVLDKTTAFFRDKKIETPRLDAELLFSFSLKMDRIQLYMKFDQPLAEPELAKLRELVRRRAQGEPVAYIVGTKDFFGEKFKVSPAVLIPRPETEGVVEEALAWAKTHPEANTILDLGAGTGCLGLSILKKLPDAKLVSVDVSADALAIAKENAESLGLSDRVRFVHCDAGNAEEILKAYKDFMGQTTIDILVSNPPYIAEDDSAVEEGVKKFEPHLALYAKEDGLALLKNWTRSYGPYLSQQSICLMEMGMSQGSAMKDYYYSLGYFSESRVIKDLSGLDRIICGVKHG